jgi:sugar lactone lactonase YvrE
LTLARFAVQLGRKGGTAMAVKVFSDTLCALGEGPIWAWDRLVWFDIEGRRLHARGRNGAETRWDFAEQASAAALLPDGFLLVAAETGLRILNAATGQHSRIAPLEAEQRTTRTNDARADRQGGFWIGTMGKTEADRAGNGAIWRFHGGMLRRLRTGVTIPNAICFAPDGRRAYFADSTRAQVYAWTLDTGGWPEGEPEVFLDLSGQGVAPDGAVVDAEGALWLALWDGGRLIRVLPDGSIAKEVALPVSRPTCPAFGPSPGGQLDRLYVTSAFTGLTEEARAAEPLAGCTFVLPIDVPGLPEPTVIIP